MPKLFNSIGAARVNRSAFNLSHEYATAFDMGQLIPVLALECVPGDVFNLTSEQLIRLQPLVAPAFPEINATTHSFFVPYRLLDESWERFITQIDEPEFKYALPRWIPSAGKYGPNSLWDYFGFPPSINPVGAEPIDYVRRAYNFIWNEYYRDENVQEKVDLSNEEILLRAWEKDYFTSALTAAQRGVAPAMPITGHSIVDFNDCLSSGSVDLRNEQIMVTGAEPTPLGGENYKWGIRDGAPIDSQRLKGILNKSRVNFENASTFDINDLRYASAVQRLLERSMRGGARYTEWLQATHGVSPKDERLDRPEYIGGSRTPVIISEVLQTSETSNRSPQGNLAGHGLSYTQGINGRYRVDEFGIIITLMSILPRASYHQGIHRSWLRKSVYDFFNPLFVNLGEQEILQSELFVDDVAANNQKVYGFQGRYNELRYMPSRVTGNLRPGKNLQQYTLTRDFGSAPGLNEKLIQCKPGKRIFAVTRSDEPSFIVRIRHHIKAFRPLPIQPIPGIGRI